MDYSEAYEVLKEHALAFHHELADAGIYREKIETEEFLTLTDESISDSAKDASSGRESIEFYKLTLPISLSYRLLDLLPAGTWDYEFGYQDFFDALDKIFQKSGLNFQWSCDEEKSKLIYSLGDKSWSLQNIFLENELDLNHLIEINKNLSKHLNKHGMVLYEAITGDQTGFTFLLPSEKVPRLRDYLIAGDDERAEWFY